VPTFANSLSIVGHWNLAFGPTAFREAGRFVSLKVQVE